MNCTTRRPNDIHQPANRVHLKFVVMLLYSSRIRFDGFPYQCLRKFFKDCTKGSCSMTHDGCGDVKVSHRRRGGPVSDPDCERRTWRYSRQSAIPIRIPACSGNGTRSIGWASAPRATTWPAFSACRRAPCGVPFTPTRPEAARPSDRLSPIPKRRPGAAGHHPAGSLYRPTAPHRARGRGPDRSPDRRPPQSDPSPGLAKKNGVGRRQTGPIPAQADPVAEPLCLDAQLTPSLDAAQFTDRPISLVLDNARYQRHALGDGRGGTPRAR